MYEVSEMCWQLVNAVHEEGDGQVLLSDSHKVVTLYSLLSWFRLNMSNTASVWLLFHVLEGVYYCIHMDTSVLFENNQHLMWCFSLRSHHVCSLFLK